MDSAVISSNIIGVQRRLTEGFRKGVGKESDQVEFAEQLAWLCSVAIRLNGVGLAYRETFDIVEDCCTLMEETFKGTPSGGRMPSADTFMGKPIAIGMDMTWSEAELASREEEDPEDPAVA